MSVASGPHDEQAFAEFSELVFQLFGASTSNSSLKTPTSELTFAEEDAVRMSEVLNREDAAELYGMELDRALKERQLPVSGTVEEKKRWLQERFDTELEERIAARLDKERTEKAKKAEAALRERRMSSWCSTEEEEHKALEQATDVKQMLSLTRQHLGPTYLDPTVDGVLTRALAKSLFRDSYILQLDLSGCAIGDESAAFIAKAVRKNRTLLSLDLNRCECGIIFLKNMAKSLAVNRTLQSISLEHNKDLAPMHEAHLADESDAMQRDLSGLIPFSRALRKNNTLRSLSFFGCRMGPSAGAVFLEGMDTNTGLVSLQTAYNDFHPMISRAIADHVEQNRAAIQETRKAEGIRRREQKRVADEQGIKGAENAKRLSELQWLEEESRTRADHRQLLSLVAVQIEKADDMTAEQKNIIDCLSRTYWPKSGKKPKAKQSKKKDKASESNSGVAPKNSLGVELQEVPGYRADYVELAAEHRRAELKAAKASAAAKAKG